MLRKLEIENLGPIADTAIDLSPLTVLLGTNASGKTSVLRSIELFTKLLHEPMDRIFFAGRTLAGEGWRDLFHRGDESRTVAFKAFVREAVDADYEVRLGVDWARLEQDVSKAAPTPAQVEILSERLREPLGTIEAGTGEYKVRGVTISPAWPRRTAIPSVVAGLHRLPRYHEPLNDLMAFVDSLGSARYFRPNGEDMLGIHASTDVAASGRGFVEALAALQNKSAETFAKIEARLVEQFPHLRHVRFEVGEKSRWLLFETERSSRLVPGELEAEGVLTTLFLLWAGFTTPPGGLLLLDEPETALHPHLMGMRVAFLRALSSGEITGSPMRVVVATQSVEFVRWLAPEEVRIVEHSREGTKVHRVQPNETLRVLIQRYESSVGDLWYSGSLGGVPGRAE